MINYIAHFWDIHVHKLLALNNDLIQLHTLGHLLLLQPCSPTPPGGNLFPVGGKHAFLLTELRSWALMERPCMVTEGAVES